MCLSTARRSVGEHGRIVSVEHAVQQRLGCGLVYISLCGCVVEDTIESVCLVLDSLALWETGST